MMKYINAITGHRYWYSLRLAYYDGEHERFHWHAEVGCVQQGDILHHRQIKKLVAPTLLKTPLAKRYLCNGRLKIEIIGCLGKFRKPEKCATAITVSGLDIFGAFLLGRLR
jgi:hypothetical protein